MMTREDPYMDLSEENTGLKENRTATAEEIDEKIAKTKAYIEGTWRQIAQKAEAEAKAQGEAMLCQRNADAALKVKKAKETLAKWLARTEGNIAGNMKGLCNVADTIRECVGIDEVTIPIAIMIVNGFFKDLRRHIDVIEGDIDNRKYLLSLVEMMNGTDNCEK
jgi:hypothetical protein